MHNDRKHYRHYVTPEPKPRQVDPTPALRLLLASLIVLTIILIVWKG